MKILLAAAVMFVSGCSQGPGSTVEIARFAADDLDGVIAQSEVEQDPEITSDGGGSLRILSGQPRTVRLFEVGDVDVENAILFYRAHIRTEGLEGEAYLEMICRIPGLGEFFSRGLGAPVSGTTAWTELETPFMLESGQNPDKLSLNLVVTGPGSVWVDDIQLMASKK